LTTSPFSSWIKTVALLAPFFIFRFSRYNYSQSFSFFCGVVRNTQRCADWNGKHWHGSGMEMERVN
jgi:hypothetical protein